MIRRRYVDTREGVVHLAEAGNGAAGGGAGGAPPVLLLHQSPRSCDEYREVLPLLGRSRRAITMDTLGYGASDPPAEHTIEAYGRGVVALLDALDLPTVDLVGHHTGGVVAVEVAAVVPDRVRRLVLSSTPLVDAADRARRAARPHVIDEVEPSPDGTHLLDLWRGRQDLYPPGDAALLDRFVVDALRADDAGAGHRAVGRYVMEARLPRITAPVLCIGHEQDPHAMRYLDALAAALGAEAARIPAGRVPLEHTAEAFAATVERFLVRSADRGA